MQLAAGTQNRRYSGLAGFPQPNVHGVSKDRVNMNHIRPANLGTHETRKAGRERNPIRPKYVLLPHPDSRPEFDRLAAVPRALVGRQNRHAVSRRCLVDSEGTDDCGWPAALPRQAW